MADFKRHMFRHLRSAKVWLTRAEESFDKNSRIRGELDLILAQAELQHARETSLSRQERKHYLFLRHATSFVLAAAIVVAGFGAYWGFSERHAVVPIPLAAQEAKVPPVVQNASDSAPAGSRARPAIPSRQAILRRNINRWPPRNNCARSRRKGESAFPDR
jgi:hypothetical protein